LNMNRKVNARDLHQKLTSWKPEIEEFLRSMVAIPSESRNEQAVIERIGHEMRQVGFDEVKVDGMGNILGRIGQGKRIIAMDAHVDTVGIGSLCGWKTDPYAGQVKNGRLYGRGAVDQKAGMAAMIAAARLIRTFDLSGDYTLYVVGSVQEEDCDGLCWQYIINEDNIVPECVVITEPTNLNINIGHRGRMEIEVEALGRAAHASAPQRGDNAIYAISRVVREIESLNDLLAEDAFLGKGSVAVTGIECRTPSLCAIPDQCSIHLDRRLTRGEDKQKAVREVREAIARAGVTARIVVPVYDLPSYKGLSYPTEKYFPTWVLSEDHRLQHAARATYREAFGKSPQIGKWVFSTNGVATMGIFRIPTIGFGPGEEKYAHAADERVSIPQVLRAAAWYALFPHNYLETMKGENHA